MIFGFSGIINLTSWSKSCDGSYVEKSWCDHAAGDLEGVGRGFPEMDGCQEHIGVVFDLFSGKLD